MSKMPRWGMMFSLVAFGYVLGATGLLTPEALQAQGKSTKKAQNIVSDETAAKIKTATDALRTAADAMQSEQKYAPVTTNLNAFAVLAGGVNAVEDLENNRGVDPETFAALYAGLADDNIRAKLGTDSEGRMTYDGKVIRLYPVSRLKQMFEQREIVLGLKQGKGSKPAAP
jgi:hypothetical protein